MEFSDLRSHSRPHVSFRYLVKHSSTLFSATDYEVAPPEYHRKAVWGLSPAGPRVFNRITLGSS